MAVDDEPDPPLIDLGERPPAGEPGAPAPARTPRPAPPRRYLALGAAGLLAVGFAGGIAVQRAADRPDPSASPSPATTYSWAPVHVVPAPTSGCQTSYVTRRGNRVDIRRLCVGTIRSIVGSEVTITLDDGSVEAFTVDPRTRFEGVRSLRELRVGQLVLVYLDQLTADGSHASSVVLR